jgi:uncharacterized protein YcfL
MKLFFIIVICFGLVSCQSNSNVLKIDNDITIKSLETSSNEYAIMRAAGAEISQIYVIDKIKDKLEIEYWIDHYKDGVYKGKLMLLKTQLDNNNDIKLYISARKNQSIDQLWTMAIRQDNNVSSGNAVVPQFNAKSSLSHAYDRVSTQKGNEQSLGVVVFNDDIVGIFPPDSEEETIKGNKEVLIIKCKFI